jgi:tetratricopeptide (TPR) repeat protein
MLAALWSRLSARISSMASIAVAAVVVALIVLSGEQSRTWRSSEVLWRHAFTHGGARLPEVQTSMGLSVLSLGRHDEARRHFEEAIHLEPGYADAHNNLGLVLAREGRYDQARIHFVESVRLNPTEPSAHNNLGTLFMADGDVPRALQEYLVALRLAPQEFAALNHLEDVLLTRRSSIPPALTPLIEGVVRNPRDHETRERLERAVGGEAAAPRE